MPWKAGRDDSYMEKPPQVKVVHFNPDELKAFESICDAALKGEGVKLAWSVACFIAKFNAAPLTDPPATTHAETIGK